MSGRTPSPAAVHLRVHRVVVDTLGALPREQLLIQVQDAITQRLSGATPPAHEPALAASIGGAVASQVRERLHG